jgi:hypothetical protein
VHDRFAGGKNTCGIADPVPAWGHERPDERQAYLPAMDVACEHEVHIMRRRPRELIGRVG